MIEYAWAYVIPVLVSLIIGYTLAMLNPIRIGMHYGDHLSPDIENESFVMYNSKSDYREGDLVVVEKDGKWLSGKLNYVGEKLELGDKPIEQHELRGKIIYKRPAKS